MERPWFKFYEPKVPQSIAYPSIPLYRFLDDTAAKYPDRVATVFGGKVGKFYLGAQLTYKRLKEAADRFATALQALGIKKGDKLSLHLPNCPQFIIAYYGAIKAGAIVVPTNPLYVEREIEHQFNDAGVETVVTLTRFYPLIRSVKPRTSLKNIIVTNIKEYFPPLLRLLFTLAVEKKEGHRLEGEIVEGTYMFQDLLSKHQPNPRPVDIDPEEVAVLLYTGGTTGVPKGAMLTHRNLVANTLQVRSWLTDVEEGKEVTLCALPFFHSYGMTVAMNFAINAAATMVLMPNPRDIDEMLILIDKYKVSVFPGVPTMYVAINNHPDTPRYNIRSVRACISGAAPLPIEVKQKFEEITGGKLVEGYGLTEASPVTHCNPIYGVNKTGSIGIPFPDTDARIVDLETGTKELPPGEAGELAIKGPQVMKGYWNMPEETRMVLKDGWLLTGDIAKMDEDGYFYIVDRKKDMIIAGGYNIYPREVEEVLYQHPKVKEAVVAGVPDPYRGETVKAYIVLKEGETATEEEIIEFCRKNLAKYKVPKMVEFRSELPKSTVGKLLRRVLVEEEKRKLEAQK
ncbi:MAG: long-chain fatty acid--CoA ligase [Chloroflexi bacterium]|nr:MAG: long-chain fatty acid--CoA ligase [Chloroflexota bacterium]